MDFSKIDIFSSPFQFHFGINTKRKGSLSGAILSICLIVVMLIYSSYLFYLYFNNQINPNYSSQSFISEETISVDLQNDLFGFKYEYGVNLNLDDLQEQQNKTYLVYVPFFSYQNGSDYSMIPLNYTKCSSAKLQGFNCLDFSNLKNYSLTLSTQDNISSYIYMFVYQCQDTDMFKEFIPDNCAKQTEINSVVNNPYANLRLKFLTSQYNTTSQAIQTNYRNSYVYMQGDQFQLYTFKTQKQITQLKQGAIIQSESTFSSPISYDIQNFSQSRESMIQNVGQTAYLQFTIQMDEIVQVIQIQYSTFPQILAQCNSTLALLMCLGFLGRNFAQRLMRQEIFLLMLQNMFLGTYQNILKESKILDKKDDNYFKNQMKFDQNRIEEREEDLQVDSVYEIFIPSFDTKLIKSINSSHNQSPINQIQPPLNSPIYKNNRFTSFELAEQKLQVAKKKRVKSIFNQEIGLKSQQRRIQKKKKLANSQLSKQNSLKDNYQIQSTFENNNLKSQESSQESESLFKTLSKPVHFKKRDSIYSEGQRQDTILQTEKIKRKNFVEEYYFKKIKAIKCQSVLKNIQNKIFKMKCFKVSDYQQSQGLGQNDKRAIDDYINQSLDVLQLYRDITFLKKAALILLSKDQLAILQLVGLSSDFQKEPDKMSFFEEQYSILSDSSMQEKYIHFFFKRIQDNQEISETDLRILDSLQ
ncbi:AMP-binding enzyme family protein (macronuclear) [Tetrahymena thermophila SB210]|uniref:AMP-binding enzyme family protein n=1 Tax=Tetrahymena thermophila (strain SB210) TaxID=312017 RepID=W7XJ32_TETTS|nr:AMP-binding enzyme family protein [Tetrahymena thermophila SB210]EWS75166.1 AMP-binding enzyme family protein [Tetrahymena thermophila SB210]|eukprot:XP_012652322.1 AMP-binding enzyme family protein [Tetrahymena thermophila SB210]